jgi:pimeloyl-ACP methyl ester carboxylesterase
LSTRADLTRYTTAYAAADYVRILRGLGYARVNLWGTSYGTRLGLAIARDAPGLVRTLVLDAVVPTSFTWPETAASDLEAALDILLADCEADPPCTDAFPKLRPDTDRAFAQLNGRRTDAAVVDPATGTASRVSFGASDLAYAVRGLLYGREARRLPSLFQRAAGGDYDAFAQAYVSRARALDRQIAVGVHLGVYCAEDLPYVNRSRAIALALPTAIGTYLLDQYTAACAAWPRATIASGFRDPVSLTTPTLLLSGRHDPVTPARLADDVARTLANARTVVWPHGGHATDGLVTNTCKLQIIRDFIAAADARAVSTACMSNVPVIPFQLAGTR